MDNLHNIEAERAVIGSVLLDNGVLDAVSLHVADFFHMPHRVLWKACLDLHADRKPCDQVTIGTKLLGTGDLQKIGGVGIFETLADCVGSTASAPAYAAMVAGLAARRRVIEQAKILITLAGDTGEPLLDTVADATRAINESATIEGDGDMISWGECLESVYKQIDAPAEHSKRVATGIGPLDRLTGGLHNNLTVLASRPGMGKSALSGIISENVARMCTGDECIYFACLEDDPDTFARRSMARNANVSMGKLEGITCGPDFVEAKRILDMCNKDHKLPIWFDRKPVRTPGEIRGKFVTLSREKTVKLVIVDHLQRLVDDSDAYAATSKACRAMANLAGDFGVPVLLVAQLSRKLTERQDKRPVVSDLRDSGKIEEDARAIWFLYRDYEYNKNASPNDAELIIAKSNHGNKGIVRLFVDLDKMRFGEIEADY